MFQFLGNAAEQVLAYRLTLKLQKNPGGHPLRARAGSSKVSTALEAVIQLHVLVLVLLPALHVISQCFVREAW